MTGHSTVLVTQEENIAKNGQITTQKLVKEEPVCTINLSKLFSVYEPKSI